MTTQAVNSLIFPWRIDPGQNAVSLSGEIKYNKGKDNFSWGERWIWEVSLATAVLTSIFG